VWLPPKQLLHKHFAHKTCRAGDKANILTIELFHSLTCTPAGHAGSTIPLKTGRYGSKHGTLGRRCPALPGSAQRVVSLSHLTLARIQRTLFRAKTSRYIYLYHCRWIRVFALPVHVFKRLAEPVVGHMQRLGHGTACAFANMSKGTSFRLIFAESTCCMELSVPHPPMSNMFPHAGRSMFPGLQVLLLSTLFTKLKLSVHISLFWNRLAEQLARCFG